MKPHATAAATLVGLAAGAASAGPTGSIEEGRPFPQLVLPALEDGSPRSIADYRGKKVVLHVFASW